MFQATHVLFQMVVRLCDAFRVIAMDVPQNATKRLEYVEIAELAPQGINARNACRISWLQIALLVCQDSGRYQHQDVNVSLTIPRLNLVYLRK